MRKTIILLLNVVLLFSFNNMHAQDDPSDAAELTVGVSFDDFSVIASNVGATSSEIEDPSIGNPSCIFYDGRDIWHFIEVPTDGIFIVETRFASNAMTDTGVSIYEGEIGALVEIGCDNDNGEGFFSKALITDRTPGEILYIRSFSYSDNEAGQFQLSVYTDNLATPTNDDFVDYTTLVVGSTFENYAVLANNTVASNSEIEDPSIPSPTCGAYQGKDLWYAAEVPPEGVITLEVGIVDGGLEETGMSIYEGSLGNLTQVECDSGDGFLGLSLISLTERTPGELLYIRVWGFSNFVGEFEVSAYTGIIPPPVNDDFDGALSLNVGIDFEDSVVEVNNTGTTNSEVSDPSIPDPTCASYQGGDLWFSIEVPEEGFVTVETGNPSSGISDTGMSLYEGTEGNLIQISCNDDGGEGNFSAISVANRVPGEILFMRVWEYSNNSFGTFQVSAYTGEVIGGPDNDNLDGAIELIVGNDFLDSFTVGSNVSATDSEILDPSLDNPTCGSYNGADVWFSAVVPSSGDLVIQSTFVNFSPLADAAMSIYEGEMGDLTEIACNDDTDNSLFPMLAFADRTPGEVLYIRYFAYNNDSSGEFIISAYDEDLVDVDNQNTIEGFSFFPNPARNILNLRANSSIEAITVYNLLGEQMMHSKPTNSDYQLDLETLKSGTYMIEVKIDHQIAVYKFLKI